jgi:CO dehydrogenase/acetyl-CoA synthase alpha subunit
MGDGKWQSANFSEINESYMIDIPSNIKKYLKKGYILESDNRQDLIDYLNKITLSKNRWSKPLKQKKKTK